MKWTQALLLKLIGLLVILPLNDGMAASFEKYRLRSQVTLRVLKSNSGKNFLDFVVNVPEGAVISVDTSVDHGRQYYSLTNQVVQSVYGWFRGVRVESGLSDDDKQKLMELSPESIYISKTFKNVADPVVAGENDSPDSSSVAGESTPDVLLSGCQTNRLVSQGVPQEPAQKALEFFEANKNKITNQNWLSLADYSQNSKHRRFYLIDMRTCKVVATEFVAHGSGSRRSGRGRIRPGDPNHDGMLDKCVDDGRRLNMTRPGFMLVKGWHQTRQSWPVLNPRTGAKALSLVGLESQNDDVFGRGVVMHEAHYVQNTSALQGRSYGCPAFAKGRLKNLLQLTRGELNKGTLFFAYAPMCDQGS